MGFGEAEQVLTIPTSCLFTLALPTCSPHLTGPPRAWRLDWGEAWGRRVLEGVTRVRGAEEQKGRAGR